MDGDKPITRREDDRLGFASVAEHLASSIVGLPAAEGFVFGIEGRWGSGKSTLINLTMEALKTHGGAAPEVITFSPWLVGDRDELLRSLFSELASAAVKIDPIEEVLTTAKSAYWVQWFYKNTQNPHWKLRQKEQLRKSIGGKLTTFGNLAGAGSKLARAASSWGLPAAEAAATLIERSGDAAKGFLSTTSISKAKAELVGALRLLSRRIIWLRCRTPDRLSPAPRCGSGRCIDPVRERARARRAWEIQLAWMTEEGYKFLPRGCPGDVLFM
jgi:hypothetical protein